MKHTPAPKAKSKIRDPYALKIARLHTEAVRIERDAARRGEKAACAITERRMKKAAA
jgi:hypothetical protein